MYHLSRFVGLIFLALGGYILFQAVHFLNLQQEILDHRYHRPIPSFLRLPEGIFGLLIALGFLGAGLRFLLKPVRANEKAL